MERCRIVGLVEECEGQSFLGLVRRMIVQELGGQAEIAAPADLPAPPVGGAFVTLSRRGRLRGCMGTFAPKETLFETLKSVSRSACRDPRFVHAPVTLGEVPDLAIELSLLSALMPAPNREQIRVGQDGIVIRRGSQSGCFLPHVAVQHNWSAVEFLEQCAVMKAGLSPDAWRDPVTEVLVFTAQVFRERTGPGAFDVQPVAATRPLSD